MSTKHTPGTWVNEPGSSSVYAIGENGYNRLYLHVDCWVEGKHSSPAAFDEVNANCQLISAAPDLLKACIEAKKHLVADLVGPGRTVFWNLVNAINKAEGRA